MTSLLGGAPANRRAFTVPGHPHWEVHVSGRLVIAEAGTIQSVGEINLDATRRPIDPFLLCFPSVEGTIHVYPQFAAPYEVRFPSAQISQNQWIMYVNIRAIVCGYCPAQTQQYALGKG
jgi:hypothetical protein